MNELLLLVSLLGWGMANKIAYRFQGATRCPPGIDSVDSMTPLLIVIGFWAHFVSMSPKINELLVRESTLQGGDFHM